MNRNVLVCDYGGWEANIEGLVSDEVVHGLLFHSWRQKKKMGLF